MKAIQLPRYGGADVLQLVDIDQPLAKANEVLIQVKAAALNPIDSKIRNGYLKEIIPLPLPLVPGWEAAGIVVNSQVAGFAPGDEVVTRVPFQRAGAYAEYMVAGEEEVVHKPKSLSFVEAASMPIVAGAAYTLLHRSATLHKGERIFILGAGGSVGLYAIQMARAAGAFVIATATGDDIGIVRSYGADEVIDYKVPGFASAIKDVDLALDFAGGPAQDVLWPLMKKGGLLFSTATPPSPDKARETGVQASFIMTTPDTAIIEKVLDMAVQGQIKPRIGKTLPLADAARAHELMDKGLVSGKIVLVME